MLVWAVGVFVCAGLPDDAAAEEQEPRSPRWHLFFGIDGAEDSFFGHGGLVWAPFGDLDNTGWRLRAAANGGMFTYFSGPREITGDLTGAEILPGFQWIGRDAGATVYAGPTIQDQSTDPYDPGKPRQGTRFGAKVLVEGWARAVDGVFLNASGSYATAAETYSARLSAAVDIAQRFALEPEIAAFGEPGYDQQRYGVLLQYRHSRKLHIKVGGGWAVEPDADGPYGAFQVKIWQ
jgi:hypothetical protein